MSRIVDRADYIFNNCPIPGGGYVTGFIFHEKDPSILYIRTDIGGTYRYDREENRWHSLIDHVTMEDLAETYPIALALDRDDPDILYIACGDKSLNNSKLAVSRDRGESFTYYDMPMRVHGNLNGRGTGFRLITDRNDRERLFFASQMDGLWVSDDGGADWSKLNSFKEQYTTFVGQSPDGRYLFAAGAGVTTRRSDRLRGHSLYISADGGETFTPLTGPADMETDGVAFAGHVAQRYAIDDEYLYVTYAVMGRNAYVHELGYSCDGGSVIGGRVYRYGWDDIGGSDGEDITPPEYGTGASGRETLLEYGFGGISAGRGDKGLLITSTICRDDGDCIYRSSDYGSTWECVLHGLDCGVMDFKTSYMKPEYNGGLNLIHWLTDIKLNPHDEHEAWFNTGTGVFRTADILADEVHFSDCCDGIEETVHLNLYSPPAGDVLLIDILGDLGGFAFRELDKPCDNSFADDDGNRYITCINADYSDFAPKHVIVTPRGNWTGRTKGGLIISHDGCRSFARVELPYGISEKLDAAFRHIETPNVNSGWVAMSPDTENIVWSVADNIQLPSDMVIVSHDGGRGFTLTCIFDLSGERVTEGGLKVFADRCDSRIFYGFGDASQMYISRDSGETFTQINTPEIFPETDFSLIDCADGTEIRAESGVSGVLYAAAGRKGLWKLIFNIDEMSVDAIRLSGDDDIVYHVGLGIGRRDGDYLNEPKALYLSGVIDGAYGFYRTLDEGGTYVRLGDDAHMYGDINSIEGDSRVFGRFYLATGSRGVVYGTPK